MIILPPKQTNRFRIEFLLHGNNIDELSNQVVQVDPIRYTPKTAKHPVLMAVFEDDVQNRVMKALQSLWDQKLCIKLSILDGNDVAMLRWTFDDGAISAFTHGPFDYSLNAAMLVQGEFTCSKAEMKVLR
jgi:hypothetical protein